MKKLLCLSLLTFLTSCSANLPFNSNIDEVDEIPTLNILQRSSGTNSSGFPYQTYSYEVSTIGNQTNPDMSISFSFADQRENVSDYLTGSVDKNNKEFTIVCKRDFNSVATARLYATNQPLAYADITINYAQKLKDGGLDLSQPVNYPFQSSKYYVSSYEDDIVSDSMPRLSQFLGTIYTVAVSEYTVNPLNFPAASNYTFYGFDDDATPSHPNSNMQRHWISDRFLKEGGTYQGADLATLNTLLYNNAFSGYALSWDTVNMYKDEYYYSDSLVSLYYRLDKRMNALTLQDRQTVKNNLVNGKLPCKLTLGGDYILVKHDASVKKLTTGTTCQCYDENGDPTSDVLESVYVPDGAYLIVLFDWLSSWDTGSVRSETNNIVF